MVTINVREEVAKFAQVMEHKLRCNDHKPHWKELGVDSAQWFLDRLREEVEELDEALSRGDRDDIMKEAADVGNYAMMIMDIYARGGNGIGICDYELERAERGSIPRPLRVEGRARSTGGERSAGDVEKGR